MCGPATRRSLRKYERKSLAVGSDGGYLVPEETEREIGRRLASVSPIRAIAGLRQVSSNVYKKPFAITGAATGWVGETDSRTETTAPTLAELEFPAMELYAMPAATATLLDDAAVDIDAWIADEVETAFATQEGTAFVTGDGDKKPTGFLAYTTVAEAAWAWTKIGYLVTGVSGAFAASDPVDDLIDLVYALKSGYRQNAHFVMNCTTQGAVRKLKDADGNYIWQPGDVGRRPVDADELPDRRIRGHAGHRRRHLRHRLRRLSPRLPGGRPASGCGCSAIPIPPSPTCSSTPPSGSAAASRTSTPSSSSNSARPEPPASLPGRVDRAVPLRSRGRLLRGKRQSSVGGAVRLAPAFLPLLSLSNGRLAMTAALITGPALEPVSLADVKAHLRVDTDDEDALLIAAIVSARVHVEAVTRRVLIEQSWRVYLDAGREADRHHCRWRR